MTIPSTGPISFYQISTDNADGFGLGYSMASYKGQIYDNKAGGCGAFSSGAIALGDFLGKRRVDGNASGVNFTSAGSSAYTIPPYKTITITVKGAGGGGGGGGGGSASGLCSGTGGGPGGSPGNSSFGSSGAWYLSSASGGGGGGGGGAANGATGGAGADYGGGNGGAAGGAGSGYAPGNGGPGGGGQTKNITLTNPAIGGTGPTSGSSIAYNIAGGGSGGGGGTGYKYDTFGGCVGSPGNNGGGGNGGGNGSVAITWTGT